MDRQRMDAGQVRSAYDGASRQYFDRFGKELDYKPFDRELLNEFVAEAASGCVLLDLGCGPGHVTEFLQNAGGNVVGIDLAPEMIAEASRQFPGCRFQVADFRSLPFGDGTIGGIVAFYSIVHFSPDELSHVFREMERVLTAGAQLLLSFHVGDEDIVVDDFLMSGKSLRFQFLQPDAVLGAAIAAGLEAVSCVVRQAYPQEHPTQRCYLKVRRPQIKN